MQSSFFTKLYCCTFIMNKETLVKIEVWKISLEEFLKRTIMDLNETFRGASKGCYEITQIRISHCYPKMIMSCLAKIKMSSLRDAKMFLLKGGHHGRRGHDHATSERIKAATHPSEGS